MATERNNHITVIIPAYHSWETLWLCLEALTGQDFPASSFDVLVVNNAPQDLCPWPDKLPGNCRVINAPKTGSYAARNAGIKAARGSILAFTDSDCIPGVQWLSRASGYFAGKNTNLGDGQTARHAAADPIQVLAGKVELFSKDPNPNPYALYDIFDDFQVGDWVELHGYAATANLFVRRELFDRNGLFRDDLYSGGDTEWTNRAVRNGIRLAYADDVIVRHPARNSFQQLAKVRRRRLGGLYTIGREHAQPVHKKLFRILKLLALPLRLLRMKRFRSLSPRRRLQFFVIRYRIKWAELGEYVRLLFGGSPRND